MTLEFLIIILFVWAVLCLPIGAKLGYVYERSGGGIGTASSNLGALCFWNVLLAILFSGCVITYFTRQPLISLVLGVIYGVVVFIITVRSSDRGYQDWKKSPTYR